jgi:hypothetical protein
MVFSNCALAKHAEKNINFEKNVFSYGESGGSGTKRPTAELLQKGAKNKKVFRCRFPEKTTNNLTLKSMWKNDEKIKVSNDAY